MQGTLLDRVLYATYTDHKQWGTPQGRDLRKRVNTDVRKALTGAKVYHVDNDIARASTRFAVDHPDLLLQLLPQARLPFSKTWIEWDQREMLHEQAMEVAPDAPERTGVLLEQLDNDNPILHRASVFGWDAKSPDFLGIPPFSILYSLDLPIQPFERLMPNYDPKHFAKLLGILSEVARTTGMEKSHINACLIGSAMMPKDDWSEPDKQRRIDLCNKMISHAMFTHSPWWATYERRQIDRPTQIETMSGWMVEYAGCWRVIMSLLALIQNREFTSYTQVENPARRRFIGNQIVPWQRYHTIRLQLPRKIVLRELIKHARTGLRLPQYEYEGHWCYRHGTGSDDCHPHAYTLWQRKLYKCELCGRIRYYRISGTRGDPTIGRVEHTRVMTRRGRRKRPQIESADETVSP